MLELDDFEYAVLLGIYEFSAERGFSNRFGINQRYILGNIGYHHSNRFEQVLETLFVEKLIFYKTRHGYWYWLPTKKGREYIECY